MERIVVTGHQGFIGRALVAELLKRKYVVLPIGRDFTQLECDRVYHLASPSTTERIAANPLAVMDSIMDATRSALKICPSALFINASSKGADELVNSAQGCYNVAKRCMEQYIQYSGVEYMNYRIPSVYGPGMHNSNFIKRCVDGNATVPTTPDKLHYIAHIDDVVDALINLTPIQTETISLGEIYADFSTGRRGIYRPTFGTQATE